MQNPIWKREFPHPVTPEWKREFPHPVTPEGKRELPSLVTPKEKRELPRPVKDGYSYLDTFKDRSAASRTAAMNRQAKRDVIVRRSSDGWELWIKEARRMARIK